MREQVHRSYPAKVPDPLVGFNRVGIKVKVARKVRAVKWVVYCKLRTNVSVLPTSRHSIHASALSCLHVRVL